MSLGIAPGQAKFLSFMLPVTSSALSPLAIVSLELILQSYCFQFTGNFSFLGTRILDKVIDALLLEGLYHSKHLLLAGSRYKTLPCDAFCSIDV